MARYTHCQHCGNEEEGTDLYQCYKCGTYYCVACAIERDDGYHCPECEDTRGKYLGNIYYQKIDYNESNDVLDYQESENQSYDSESCYYCGLGGTGEYHYEDFFHRKCWDDFINTNRFKEWEKASKEVEKRKQEEEKMRQEEFKKIQEMQRIQSIEEQKQIAIEKQKLLEKRQQQELIDKKLREEMEQKRKEEEGRGRYKK